MRSKIEHALSVRPLLFFSSRSMNAVPLLDRGWLHSAVSLTAPLQHPDVDELCLEHLTQRRIDGNTYTFDAVYDASLTDFTRAMEDRLRRPHTIFLIRPNLLVESTLATNGVDSHVLANPAAIQTAFEYKPWVEASLRRLGVRTIPWQSVLAHELQSHLHSLQYPLVARGGRSESGSHVWLIEQAEDMAELSSLPPTAHVSIAQLLAPSISLNVHGVVYASGNASLHPPSIQILGDPILATRRFGYCGNDFAAVRQLDPQILLESEIIVRAVAQWLAEWRYLGVFGVDLLVHNGVVYFVELNARFQGSSILADRLDCELGRPGIYALQIAAFLGLDGSDNFTLEELVKNQRAAAYTSQINTDSQPMVWLGWEEDTNLNGVIAAPEQNVVADPSAIMYQVLFDRKITDDGGMIESSARKRLAALAKSRRTQPAGVEVEDAIGNCLVS